MSPLDPLALSPSQELDMRRSLIAVLAGVCLLASGQAQARPKPHPHHQPIIASGLASGFASGLAPGLAPDLADTASDAPREIARSMARAGGYAIVKTKEGAGR